MGYTHYWNTKNMKNARSKMGKVISEIEILLKKIPTPFETAGQVYEKPLVLKGGCGIDEPFFTKKEIWFNGDKTDGDNHETFYFSSTDKTDFDFCKTARKPYDIAVCLCLLSLGNNIEGFTFTSDGNYQDWIAPIHIYQDNIGDLKPEIIEYFNNKK
jgi:hypothetical protein